MTAITTSRPDHMPSSTYEHGPRSRMSTLRIALLALLALVGAALPVRATAQAPIASFQAAECFVPTPEGYAIDCGYILAPESHDNFDGELVALATVIVRSPNPDPAPDPLVFLSGGPGDSATQLVSTAPRFFERVLANRDVIFFDQRGTGYSRPSLSCPPVATDSMSGRHPISALGAADRPAFLQQQIELYTACGQHYQQLGVDLANYNTPENAADIEDLRRALGYPQLNLLGGSYGTRLALEAMRFRPDTIRSVVLDSVAPQPYNFQAEVPAAFNRSLEGLFAACDVDPACGVAYPNLLARWDELIARLNEAPAQLPILNLETGETMDYMPINGWDLTATMFSFMYVTEALPLLPLVVAEASAGNYAPLSALLSPLYQPPSEDAQAKPPFAVTMQTAFQCYDDMPFLSAEDFIRVRDEHRRGQPLSMFVEFNEAYAAICANLGLGTDTPPFLNQPVTSDVPALLIAGELDPITRPEQAYEAAETLTHSTVVVYPRGGHGPSGSSPCLRNAIAAFIENPTAPPDTSCIASEGPLPFVVGAQAEAALRQLTVDRSWAPLR